MKKKNRFSLPGSFMDLLLGDENFLQEVLKTKKFEQSFPKYDQWRDSEGFHMNFALAGYTPENIKIEIFGSQISITSNGIDNNHDKSIHEKSLYTPDELKEFSEKKQIVIEKLKEKAVISGETTPIALVSEKTEVGLIKDGLRDEDLVHLVLDEEKNVHTETRPVSVTYSEYVKRGIAKRAFKVSFYISEEFNLSKVKADMEHGLLHVLIPEQQINNYVVKINEGKN